MKLPIVNLSFLAILPFLAFLLYLTACKKSKESSNGTGLTSITGKWNLLTDSTFVGVGTGNHEVDYTGEPGDYFDFNTNGTVYTKEGDVLDTLTYRLLSDTTMIISDFGVSGDTCTVNSMTVSNGEGTGQFIYITSPFLFSPGGTFGRKVSLVR
jgi:hypothetical protein